VFAIYAVDEDGDRARQAARKTLAFYKTAGGRNALTDVAGISDDLVSMSGRGGLDTVTAEMPDSWVENLTIAGTPSEVTGKIRDLYAAGADSVGLVPAHSDRLDETIASTASDVIGSL